MMPEENEPAAVNLTEPDTQQPEHHCHIHDNIETWDIQSVRENVCRHLATTEHIDVIPLLNMIVNVTEVVRLLGVRFR